MGTHVIVDARARKVRASLDAPGDGTTIFAVDLIGDTWNDFAQFIQEAGVSERASDLIGRNRSVRAATASLFSHIDGIVSDVFSILRRDVSFAGYQPKRSDFCSLKKKIEAVHRFLVDHRGLARSAPSLDLKLLRDILNHPTVTKKADGGSRETVLLDAADVYGIAVQDLQAIGREFDEWLSAICVRVPYERFLDTKRIAEDFARSLGGEPISTDRF